MEVLSGARDEALFSAATEDTHYTAVIDTTLPGGVITGAVDAVAGPFPRSGTEGNIGGDAWGFYTASYRDQGSLFSAEVTRESYCSGRNLAQRRATSVLASGSCGHPRYSESSRIREPK
jgi:hypothetical protein